MTPTLSLPKKPEEMDLKELAATAADLEKEVRELQRNIESNEHRIKVDRAELERVRVKGAKVAKLIAERARSLGFGDGE